MTTLSQRIRSALPFIAVAMTGFLAAFLLVAFFVFPDDGPAAAVRVPSIVGLPFEDAERRLKAIGLVAKIGERRYSGDAPRSTVMSQSPTAGDSVSSGSEIVLDVSEGQQRATVPTLVGLDRDAAQQALRAVGLDLGDVTEQPTDSARGTVLESTPAGGQVVPLGTRVAVVISGGPAELSMPDVVGKDQATARSMLEQLGLVLAPIEHDSLSTLPAGTVVSQVPAAGTGVNTGATITLRIAGRS